jgi:hypothetical protein
MLPVGRGSGYGRGRGYDYVGNRRYGQRVQEGETSYGLGEEYTDCGGYGNGAGEDNNDGSGYGGGFGHDTVSSHRDTNKNKVSLWDT